MLVEDLVSMFDLQVKSLPKESRSQKIEGGYSGDVLSHVMACAKPGYVWLTVQTHENVIAVASLLDLACIIVCQRELPEETCARARREGVAVLWTDRSDFEMSGLLYETFCEKGIGNSQAQTESKVEVN